VAGGELTPDEVAILSNILEARRKTFETQDHENRIAQLESERGKRGVKDKNWESIPSRIERTPN